VLPSYDFFILAVHQCLCSMLFRAGKIVDFV